MQRRIDDHRMPEYWYLGRMTDKQMIACGARHFWRTIPVEYSKDMAIACIKLQTYY